MTPRTVDPAPLAGSWINFDTTATGIRLVEAGVDGGRLTLRITEPGAPETAQDALTDGPVTGAGLPAVPLAGSIDATTAVAFLAEGPLGSRQAILCGYLNRGLLTLDVHTVHPGDARMPHLMYRAHFYRPEWADPR
ncbi:hypothetical protein [Streptomyces noursei]|uniref:hypothetical protein n=1 Tax=Streptomyces noursei TaxID=1971 RepID=UPI0023B7A9C7|nr:hypothetical protein [Streptomyces noursei]